MHSLLTRSRAEAWRAAQPTPSPAQLRAFVAHQPRVLPLPTPPLLVLPDDHLRVALLVAAFVAWVLAGTLLAKFGPLLAPGSIPILPTKTIASSK